MNKLFFRVVGFFRGIKERVYQSIRDPFDLKPLKSPIKRQPSVDLKSLSVSRPHFSQRHVQVTQEAFDVEIQGKGFFALQSQTGVTLYTRNGSLRMGTKGCLEDKEGHQLVPQIAIPPWAQSVQINPLGYVSYISSKREVPKEVGRIGLVGFANPAGLRSLPRGFYQASVESGNPQEGYPGETFGVLVQGQLQVSTVDEIVGLIC